MEQLTDEDPARIGPYRLIARLGAGGMGLVYLGRSEAGRTVAVKVVQAEYAGHPEFRRRFAREVAAARKVGGSWTAAVLDADPEAAVPWVATQYVPGPDLHTVVARDFGPLPEHSVRTLANRLALALGAVHAAGLIHRDLKPSNVLVTVDGPRVIDFGIARAMDSLGGDSLHTRTGMLIGSPGFMSPEQVRGIALTPASDVFCLGAVLVYAATGRFLFGARDTGLNVHLFRVAEEEADLAGVPQSLAGLVGACLHKDPARRPSPAEVAARTEPDPETDPAAEWLPGPVLAQLGRHAARLLDYAPAQRTEAPDRTPAAVTPAAPPPVPDPRARSPHTPPAYAPTLPVPAGPSPGFGPAPSTAPSPASGPAPGPVAAPSPTEPTAPAREQAPPPAGRRRSLVVAAVAQLVVLIDDVMFRTAGPMIQADTHLSSADMYRLFGVYLLFLGGLLPLGGRVADLVGRRRVMAVALAVFAAAAVVGGSSEAPSVLIWARAVQGAAAAFLLPASLALVVTGSTGPTARRRALGFYAAVVGSGSALGVMLRELLIAQLHWRVALYAAALIAAIAAGAVLGLPADRAGRSGARLDVPGVLLGAGGLVAFTFAFGELSRLHGFEPPVAVSLALGAVLLAVFLIRQTRIPDPLLPPHFFRTPGRTGCLVTSVLAGAGLFAVVPVVFSYAAPGPGLTLLVVAVAIGSTQVSARLLDRVAPRVLIVAGLLAVTLGLFLLSGIGDSTGIGPVVPGVLLAGAGVGVALVPFLAVMTAAVPGEHSGAASGAVAAGQHMGVVLGTVLLGGFVQSADRVADFPLVVWWVCGFLLLAALVAGLTIRAGAPKAAVRP
ncbi:MFS transporter [Streptomyces sp. SPB4]|uniref:MFS transporter n=1 Tax=Streptomyces sp. SPB4 TaxID=2940553 RepID=UPI0024763E68|nr:MFS transporter [Streptomyces sp. SPB4]MDH6540341.1 serine/threonine protein kinase/MFS family permease [Streptomyces sp. SPB4]